jgi:autotransporter-associated beta strand protein
MYSTAGNLTGAVINVNSAVANAGMTLRSGGALNVAGSLTNSVGTTLGLISDTTHGGTLNILNGGTASLTTINVVDGSVLTNAGTLNATVLTLGEATGNTCGKFVMGDATGVGTTTLTQITTLGTGTANAIVGGNAASSTLTLNLSAGATFSGKLGGAGANENNLALVKQGASALTLSGLNTYTGATTINAGTLKAGVATAGADGAFGNNSAVTMANVASANLDITGFHNSIGSLAGGGTTGGNVTLGAATLTVGGNNGSASFGGVISGNGGALIKTGTGTQTFTGANTYTGTTTISAGTLLIAGGGSLAAGSAVSVNAGTLGGAGTINGTVAVASGATLQAGVSLGDAATFSLNNNLTMAAGSILSIGLGAGAATHDILARTGSGTWTFDANQSFRFLDQGAVAGTTYTGIITGLSSPASVAGWTVANSGWAGSFSINGNNIDFALSAIPEPATWGLIAGAGAILFFLRGRAGQKCR